MIQLETRKSMGAYHSTEYSSWIAYVPSKAVTISLSWTNYTLEDDAIKMLVLFDPSILP